MGKKWARRNVIENEPAAENRKNIKIRNGRSVCGVLTSWLRAKSNKDKTTKRDAPGFFLAVMCGGVFCSLFFSFGFVFVVS